MNETTGRLDIASVREKLAGKSGRSYWRSLEEIAETEEFQAWVDDEFPNRSSLMQVDRRSLLKYMGASMMLAGLGGCRSLVLPNAKMVPYVNRPEEMVTGGHLQFATAYSHSGVGTGVIVESHYGRPTKVDGNPNDKFARGASDSFMQASVLNLYDPDRTKNPFKKGVVDGWDIFLRESREWMTKIRAAKGAGFAVLMESSTSPSMIAEVTKLQAELPQAVFASWEPINRDHVYQGAQIAFGKPLETIYNLTDAKVILSLDSDFLGSDQGWLKYSREWANGRNVDGDPMGMNRVYAVETTPTITGSMADHRMPVSTVELENLARAVATSLGVPGVSGSPSAVSEKWADVIARDLQANAGSAVVIPGDFVSPAIHALCHAINAKLGAVGKTVSYHSAVTLMAGKQAESLSSLVAALNTGEIEYFLILGGNPIFNAPANLKFAEALAKVEHSAHLATYMDETSRLCEWHLPESHYLESWGDIRTLDGATVLQQPLTDPLYDTKSAWETLRAVSPGMQGAQSSYDLLKAAWDAKGLNDKAWRSALNEGVVPNTSNPPAVVAVKDISGGIGTAPTKGEGIEIIFRPDPTIYDGRYANNGWLQERPKPLTTLTWDNTVQVSPKLAESMGLSSGDEVEVTTANGKVKGPVWILPGQPENSVTIHLGYGQDMKETLVSSGTGFNAYVLQNSDSPFRHSGTLTKTGPKWPLASTQMHHYLEGRDIIEEMTLDELIHVAEPHGEGYEEEGHGKGGHNKYEMYPDWRTEFPYDGPQWGMTIDLNVCTSCHACVTACQAENNIPVVGKDQVIKGREMHWIRIDRYYGSKELGELTGEKPTREDLDNPTTHFMPVACLHCEKAPCEPVCPVAATVHSHEGLNQMVYNRCVGTRYCSNNCPYKVRRFNFLNYNDRKFSDFNPLEGSKSSRDLRVRLMVNNPDVTVRGRGVMEKCTYCVQRINAARINAKTEFSKGRREKPDPKEGEVITACQQACPTGAIVFGNIEDASSAVSRMKKLKRNYTLLGELNTGNRTTYLKKLRNPNKELENA